ncbi:insulinase family protein [Chitinophagaceae bacterium LB-8]|uniref:Insulinase family protein n=1 Tax=Paraflavisolibacter caeni TaxID=2982496 RepID=A0A9X2XU90_9BACT|nr:pitrilysin family protein [Paraflavisolibacter caeni]MCU7547758.1 insulinase family protein [Paraflavisolibacter caeni]
MKHILKHIILLTVSVAPVYLFAQMGEPYEMNINGVNVIVQPSGNEIVEVRTIIKGGVQNYPASKAGIESLSLTALTECGTLKDDKNAFKNKLDKASAQMNGYTEMDYATFRMNCIKSDFETVWQLYTDAMTIPKFDTKEFERIKQDAVTVLRANESNPDYAIRRMAQQLAFAGKDYAKNPQGTIEIVSKLTSEETKKYYQTIFNRNHLLIVIVGEIDKNDLQQKVQSFLAKIPAGKPFTPKKESYAPSANSMKYEEKEFATNYIQGITSAPQPGTPDYDAFILAMRIFYNRHFVEIRSKNGLSYAPATWFSGGLTPYASIYVTTTDPNKYIVIARQLIDKVKKEGFKEEELNNIKTVYVTQTYYQQETNSALAGALASNEVINGNWRRAYTIKDDMKKVTLSDLNRVFNKYIGNITWAYRGDPKKVETKMYTQKELPQMPQEIKPL